MKKSMIIVLILAFVFLCVGCASTASKGDKTVTSATAAQDEKDDMAADTAAQDENTSDSDEDSTGVKKVLKRAVDKTAVAVKDSAVVFKKTAKDLEHNVKASADVLAEDFNSVKNAAAKAVKGKGEFPWWIIILIVILILIIIIVRSRSKKN